MQRSPKRQPRPISSVKASERAWCWANACVAFMFKCVSLPVAYVAKAMRPIGPEFIPECVDVDVAKGSPEQQRHPGRLCQGGFLLASRCGLPAPAAENAQSSSRLLGDVKQRWCAFCARWWTFQQFDRLSMLKWAFLIM